MLLARGKTWRARWIKGTGVVGLDIAKGGLPEGSSALRELKIEVPLAKWRWTRHWRWWKPGR